MYYSRILAAPCDFFLRTWNLVVVLAPKVPDRYWRYSMQYFCGLYGALQIYCNFVLSAEVIYSGAQVGVMTDLDLELGSLGATYDTMY